MIGVGPGEGGSETNVAEDRPSPNSFAQIDFLISSRS